MKLKILEILPNFVVNLLSLLANIAVNNKSKHIFLYFFLIFFFLIFQIFQVTFRKLCCGNFPCFWKLSWKLLETAWKFSTLWCVLGLGPCLSLRTDLQVLGLGLEAQVLGLGLEAQVLGLGLETQVLGLGLEPQVLVNITGYLWVLLLYHLGIIWVFWGISSMFLGYFSIIILEISSDVWNLVRLGGLIFMSLI